MKTFYDRILKNFTEKYIKKWGSKVGVVTLPEVEEAGREMWGFDVTPEMKASVMGRGQPLFQSSRSLFGEVNYAPRIHRPSNITIDPELQVQVNKQREEVRAKYEGTDQWLKAPNGKPSNLPEDLWVTVRTPYFKAWFGDWEKEGRRDSVFMEAVDQIDRELLGLSQAEVRTFRELIQKANDQAVAQMTKEKGEQLKGLRKQWRKEAQDLMADDPVYSVWFAVQKEGAIDYLALEEIVGEYVAQQLRAKGLTTPESTELPMSGGERQPRTATAHSACASVSRALLQHTPRARAPAAHCYSTLRVCGNPVRTRT